MRFPLFLTVCLALAAVAYSQLIIDEDDPAGKKLIDLMMKAINEHEKAVYTFGSVVYTFPVGIEKKISVLLKVINAQHAVLSCTVELLGSEKEHFVAGAVQCKA